MFDVFPEDPPDGATAFYNTQTCPGKVCVGTAAFVTPCTACHQQGRTVKLKKIKTNWSQFCVNKDQMERF